jgi:hypothetical protein
VSPVHQLIPHEGNSTGWNRARQGRGASCSTLELLELRCNNIGSGCCYALGMLDPLETRRNRLSSGGCYALGTPKPTAISYPDDDPGSEQDGGT